MSGVAWIKITTTMFDDEKIRIIESMPDADTILIIWIKLLTLCGKCNNNGYILLSESILYTDEMLATIFNRPLSTIRMALGVFRQFGMIEDTDHGILVANWEKHQNIAALEKIREQTRLRVKKHRENQKQIAGNVTVTKCNATEEELDKEKEKSTKSTPRKSKYAEFVSMTEAEYQKLVDRFGEKDTLRLIEILDNYKGSKNKRYASDYRAILNWCVKRLEEEKKDRPFDSKKVL